MNKCCCFLVMQIKIQIRDKKTAFLIMLYIIELFTLNSQDIFSNCWSWRIQNVVAVSTNILIPKTLANSILRHEACHLEFQRHLHEISWQLSVLGTYSSRSMTRLQQSFPRKVICTIRSCAISLCLAKSNQPQELTPPSLPSFKSPVVSFTVPIWMEKLPS